MAHSTSVEPSFAMSSKKKGPRKRGPVHAISNGPFSVLPGTLVASRSNNAPCAESDTVTYRLSFLIVAPEPIVRPKAISVYSVTAGPTDCQPSFFSGLQQQQQQLSDDGVQQLACSCSRFSVMTPLLSFVRVSFSYHLWAAASQFSISRSDLHCRPVRPNSSTGNTLPDHCTSFEPSPRPARTALSAPCGSAARARPQPVSAGVALWSAGTVRRNRLSLRPFAVSPPASA